MSQSEQKNQTTPGSGRSVIIVVVALIVGVIAVLFLMVLRTNERGGGATYPENATSGTGAPLSQAARDLKLSKLDSHEIEVWLADKMAAAKAKVGIVNIWATWCEPCRDEMPELAKFAKTGAAPLFLISADNELDEPIVRSFLSEKGVDFETSLIDGDQQEFIEKWQTLSSTKSSAQWSMTLPVTFFIDATGKVISYHVGTTTAAELQATVEKLR